MSYLEEFEQARTMLGKTLTKKIHIVTFASNWFVCFLAISCCSGDFLSGLAKLIQIHIFNKDSFKNYYSVYYCVSWLLLYSSILQFLTKQSLVFNKWQINGLTQPRMALEVHQGGIIIGCSSRFYFLNIISKLSFSHWNTLEGSIFLFY